VSSVNPHTRGLIPTGNPGDHSSPDERTTHEKDREPP